MTTDITVPPTAFHQNTTTFLTNWTFEDLKKLNDAKSDALLPAKLVIGLYMVIGITGNSLVCYVMGFKLKMNTQNMLIIYLAVFDLLNCLICMPADIHDMTHYFYFPSEVGCKIIRMIMTFTSEASVLTLMIIAVDRFRKICKPMKSQMNLSHTRWLFLLILFVGLFLSWPALVIYGFRTIDTGIPGISGHDCSISDSLKGTLYPMVYSSTLFLLFIMMCIVLIVLYSYVLVAARRHRSYMSSNSNPNHFKHSSIRGMKYSKHNESSSVTATTDDTSGMRESHIAKDYQLLQSCTHSNTHYDNDGRSGKVITKTHGDSENMGAVTGDINCGETINVNEIENGEKAETCHHKIQTDAVALPVLDMHALGDSLHQKLETENTGLGCPRETGISYPTASNPSNICIRNKPSNEPSAATQRFKNANDDRFGDGECSKIKKRSSLKMSKLDHKTTIIAFLVTIVFILSYLPYLSLQISKQIVEGMDYDLQGAALILYNIALRSYYINSFANPIIYGLLNNRFRAQLCDLLSKLFKCKNRHPRV